MANNMIRNALIIAIILAALLLSFAGLVAQTRSQKTSAPKQPNATAPVERDKEAIIRTKLGVLLSDVDLTIGSALPPSENYRELRVHWESSKSNSTELIKRELAVGGSLNRVSAVARTGALPRQRSFELSPDQMLVVALDENEAVRWWRLMPDPRLVRAEVGHADMHSENYYLPKVDFVVECPDDPLLREVRFYQPVWNGEEFRLELLGIAPLY